MKREPAYVYFMAPVGGGRIKIGFSNSPLNRLVGLMAWSPIPLELLAVAPGCHRYEMHLHWLHRDSWSHSEWFNPSPSLLALIEDVRSLGDLPSYALPIGRVSNFPPRKKPGPSAIWTPEKRKEHGAAVRAGWQRRCNVKNRVAA